MTEQIEPIDTQRVDEPCEVVEQLVERVRRGVFGVVALAVPAVVEECLAKAGAGIGEVAKILVHQANAKLDQAIVKRLLRAAGVRACADELVPMTVGWLGNSSVATLPTLYDLLRRRRLDGHRLEAGDLLVFASVGAGMNANALAYRMA